MKNFINKIKLLIQKVLVDLKNLPLNQVFILFQKERDSLFLLRFLYVNSFAPLQQANPLFDYMGYWALDYFFGTFIIRFFYLYNPKVPLELLINVWTCIYFGIMLYDTVTCYFS